MTDQKERVRQTLHRILVTPDILERIDLIDKWIDENVLSVKTEQSVIDRKYLSTEHEDSLKYALATKVVEEILDQCGNISINENTVTVEITGIKK